MTKTIDYYSFALSPFTLFGHDALKAVADKHGCTINYKPMRLFDLWGVSGAVPPKDRPPMRQRYRLTEISRIAISRGIEVNLKPAHWPTDPNLADNCACAIQAMGDNPHGYMRRIGAAVWCEDKNIADEAVVRDALEAEGLDVDAVIAKAPHMGAVRDQNTQDAIEADAVGAPAYVYRGEVFWGQDRVEMLGEMIASGREPFIFKS